MPHTKSKTIQDEVREFLNACRTVKPLFDQKIVDDKLGYLKEVCALINVVSRCAAS